MVPGTQKPTGELYVTDTDDVEFSSGGIGMTANGAVCVTTTLTDSDFANGFLVSSTGKLCISSGAIKELKDGIARGNDGEVIVTYEASSSTSIFVNRVLVSSEMKLHVTVDVPPYFTSFNDGFSNGFG